MPIELDVDSILLRATTDLESDEDVIDMLSELKSLEMPTFLGDRIVNIEEEEREDISLTFGSEDSSEIVSFTLGGDDGVLKIYMIFDGEHREEMNSALSDIVSQTDAVEVDKFKLLMELHRDFGSLELPLLEKNLDYNVNGMRLENDGVDYIIQKEDEVVGISASFETFEIGSGYDSDIFLEKIKIAEDFLEELN